MAPSRVAVLIILMQWLSLGKMYEVTPAESFSFNQEWTSPESGDDLDHFDMANFTSVLTSTTQTTRSDIIKRKTLHVLSLYAEFFETTNFSNILDFSAELINRRMDILPGYRLQLHHAYAPRVSFN